MDKCKMCDNVFKRKYPRAKQRKIYCSKKCRYKDFKKYEKTCLTCNKQFIAIQLKKNKEYCSLACIKRYPCQLCGKIIMGRITFQSGEKRFCSRTCSNFVHRTMNSKKVYVPKGFSETIKKFGKIICERCNFEDVATLCVHHKDGNRDNNNTYNLETLCANCHHKEHWGDGKNRIQNIKLAYMLSKI